MVNVPSVPVVVPACRPLDSYDDARDWAVLFVRDLSLDADLCAGLRMHGQEEESGQRCEPQTQMGAIAVFHVQRFLGW